MKRMLTETEKLEIIEHEWAKARARYSAQTGKLGKAQLRIMADGRGTTPASQCSGNRTGQQAGADRLDCVGAETQLRSARHDDVVAPENPSKNHDLVVAPPTPHVESAAGGALMPP